MTPDHNIKGPAAAPKKKSRPFPWLCPRCMQKKVEMAMIAYQAKRRRGGQLITVEIPDLRVPKCANCGELLITYEVDDQIRAALDAAEQQVPERQAPAIPRAGIA